MTREEAIKILKAIRVYECYPKSASEETKEAIDMAIEALSSDAEQGGRYENAMQKLREMPRYLNGVKEKQIKKISADAEPINCVKCKHYYETEDDTDVHGYCRMDTVVRCNDCKWYQGVHGIQGHAPCEWLNKQVLWNDFCSDGEPYKGGDAK